LASAHQNNSKTLKILILSKKIEFWPKKQRFGCNAKRRLHFISWPKWIEIIMILRIKNKM
jgi:hypothetical protein